MLGGAHPVAGGSIGTSLQNVVDVAECLAPTFGLLPSILYFHNRFDKMVLGCIQGTIGINIQIMRALGFEDTGQARGLARITEEDDTSPY